MIGRNDFHFGGQVEAIGEFINYFGGGIIKLILSLAMIAAFLSVPAAAIKYLFWG